MRVNLGLGPIAVVVLAAAAALPTLSATQAAARGATLVLVTGLPPGDAGAVVQRETGRLRRNLILMDHSSSVEDLATALAVLQRSQMLHGVVPQRSMSIAIPQADRARVRRGSAVTRLRRYLDDLRTAPPRHLDGLGKVRAIVVPLDAGASKR